MTARPPADSLQQRRRQNKHHQQLSASQQQQQFIHISKQVVSCRGMQRSVEKTIIWV